MSPQKEMDAHCEREGEVRMANVCAAATDNLILTVNNHNALDCISCIPPFLFA